MENKINFILPDEVVTQAQQKLEEVNALLQPYLISPYSRRAERTSENE